MSSGAQPYAIVLPDQTTLEIILPHEAYYHMVESEGLETFCPTEAEHAAGDGLANLIKEWARHRDVGIDAADVTKLAAIGLHCDGVPCASSVRPGGSKSLFVCSLNVISAADERARANRQPACNIQKAKMWQRESC